MENKAKKIFIVEDDVTYALLTEHRLNSLGYHNITKFDNAKDLFANLHLNPYLILLDHNLNEERDGIDLLKEIRSLNPSCAVFILSAQESIEIAVRSLKFGANDYLIKNDEVFDRLVIALEKLESIHKLIDTRMRKNKIKRLVFALVALTVIAASIAI